MGIPKARVICCAIRGHPQIGFRCFMSTTAETTSWLGPLGPGFVGPLDEKNWRYFRWISIRCRRNRVDGLKTIAERRNRLGRIKSVHRPATTRSEGRRLGDRFRERLRISSWCLTSTDSATTERAPPGPASRATVASSEEIGRPDRAPHNPSKVAARAKNAHDFWNSPCTAPSFFPGYAPASARIRHDQRFGGRCSRLPSRVSTPSGGQTPARIAFDSGGLRG